MRFHDGAITLSTPSQSWLKSSKLDEEYVTKPRLSIWDETELHHQSLHFKLLSSFDETLIVFSCVSEMPNWRKYLIIVMTFI